MSSAAAQLRFAADFAVFLVAGAGLTLLVVRPALMVAADWARGLVGFGFGVLAVASVVSGVTTEDQYDTLLVVLGLAAAVLLAVAVAKWPGAALGRLGFATGVAAIAAAQLARGFETSTPTDLLRLVAAAGLGLGIFLAARRSIPARIATSASAVLLAVVLAVSVGLSAVLANNVEDEAIRRLGATGSTEASLARHAAQTAQQNASLISQAIPNAPAVADALANLVADPNASTDVLDRSLSKLMNETLREIDPQLGPLLLLDDPGSTTGRRLLTLFPDDPNRPREDESVLAGIQGSAVVTEAAQTGTATQSVVTAGGQALGVAASPITVGQPQRTIAIVVVTSVLDDGYLTGRLQEGSDANLDGRGLAFVTNLGVVASAGSLPPSSDMIDLAGDALASGSATRTSAGLLLSARPVLASDDVTPVFATVVATPTSTIQSAREDLFRLLFLIATGGTALALVLTALVGERIGAGLRRLTAVTGEITSGNLGVESEVRSDDELGVLSAAINSMTGSLRQMNVELRTSAEDEARLRARMEAVVGGMGEALVAVDDHGDVTDFNPAAELLTGVAARKARGRPVDQIVRLVVDESEEPATFTGIVEEAWTRPATVLHATGIEVPVLVSAAPLRGAQHQMAGAVYVLRDVRREREIERIKSDLLANISHELRTPLSPIKAYSQILRARDIPAEDVKRFANEIEKSSARLERVVVQLVNFASMSAGRYEVRTEPVVVKEVLERVVTRWTERLDPGVHPLSRRVARGVGKSWLDKQAIEQALDELIDNAVKYSPQGGRIDVVATAEEHVALGPALCISVVDRGVGIPADRLDVVIEDFTQADGSTTRSYGGLGLGLALVGRIVRAHGGELEIDSNEGKGTKMTMVLPQRGDREVSG